MASCCDCDCASALCTVADSPLIRNVAANGCVHFGLSIADTNCIDMSVSGTGELEVNPIISPDSNNSLECRSNGLYTPGPNVSDDDCNALSQRADGLYVQQRGTQPIVSFTDYASRTLDPGDVAVNEQYHVLSSSWVSGSPPPVYNPSPTTAGWVQVPITNPSDCRSAHLFYNLQASDVWIQGLAGTATPWQLQFRSAVFNPVSSTIIPLGPGTLFEGANGDEQCLPVHDTDRIETIVAGYSGNWAITGLMEVRRVGDTSLTFPRVGLLFMSGLITIAY